MPKAIELKGVINDLISKIGRKGNRFCEIKIRMPVNAATITSLVGLQAKTVSISMTPIQEELFTDDE